MAVKNRDLDNKNDIYFHVFTIFKMRFNVRVKIQSSIISWAKINEIYEENYTNSYF